MSLASSVRSLFAADTVPPAMAALDAALAEQSKLQRRRGEIGARMTSYRVAIRDRDALRTQIENIRDAIDKATATAEYHDEPAPDLTADRAALAEAQRRLPGVENAARNAELVLPLLESDFASLAAELETLKTKISPLLRGAIREEMDALAPELAEAEALLREVHRRVFARATAHDMLTLQEKSGDFVSSALFSELRVTKPLTSAFYPEKKWPEQELRAQADDEKRLRAEAVEFVNQLLSRGG